MAVWTLTIQEIINYFSALTGAKVSADVSELVKDLHINRSEETYPYLAPVGLGSTLIQLVRGFPATTGGQKLAPLFQSITTDGTYYTATDAGVITQIPAKDFTFSLLNALGVSVTTLSDTIWTSVCNALSNIYGKEVTVDNITEFMVLAVVQNGSLMFDEATIKAFSDSLFNEGFFSTGEITFEEFFDSLPEGYSYLTFDTNLGYGIELLEQAVKNLVPYTKQFDTFSLEYGNPKTYTKVEAKVATALTHLSSVYSALLATKPVSANGAIWRVSISNDSATGSSNEMFVQVDWINYTLMDMWQGRKQTTTTSTPLGNTYTRKSVSVNGSNSLISRAVRLVFNNDNTFKSLSSPESRAFIGYLYQNSEYGNNESYISGYGTIQAPALDGIDIQDGATLPSSDLDLPSEYPAWAADGVNAGYWDDAASLLRTRKMIPVALQEESETYVTPQALARDGVVDHAGTKAKTKILDGTLDVLDEPTDWVDEGTRTIPLDIPTSPEPINTDTPPVVLPAGTAGGPVTVYNPTQAQMDSLRTELWNNGLVTSVQALFNANPMDAIISCHMIYASPHVDAIKKGLYLGNVSMNISGVNVVDEQFIEVDCGTVSVPELFGNATDYEPYTSVEIYLPFIGIQQLSANDVVGGSVSLVMKEDVLTGAILAEVSVTKNGSTQTLYQFTGNGAVQIPLTGQDRLSQIMGGIKGALSGGFTGGVAGALMGAASGAIASKPSIMKSGGFSPNTGAMAGKLPYLIINRNVPLDASEYNKFTGYPSNKKVNLGSVSGFTRVKDVHVEGIICTEQEKTLIEEALKEGIFL